ncbi:hypothetical protein ATANTOWER_014222, partial [Ataeniobius toweri]|nr:hypothetical protein [Ataeniobius toweri]
MGLVIKGNSSLNNLVGIGSNIQVEGLDEAYTALFKKNSIVRGLLSCLSPVPLPSTRGLPVAGCWASNAVSCCTSPQVQLIMGNQPFPSGSIKELEASHSVPECLPSLVTPSLLLHLVF